MSTGAPHEAGRVDDAVFLVCSERSGSTLLTHMLGHHPQLSWADALLFPGELVPAEGQWPPLEVFYDFLAGNRFFQSSGLTIDRRLDYVGLIRDFLVQERARKGRPIVGATVHRHFNQLPWFFPTCRFIHLVRDGRDVSRSTIGIGVAGNVWRGARWWMAAETMWDELRPHLPPERCHEVRYEALIRAPEATLAGICAFIGIPYSEQMLSYPEHTNYTPVDPALVEQWRRGATPREIRLIEAVAGPMLVARGYQLSGLPPLSIGRLQRLWLREHDRYGRVRFRIKRQGFALTAADFLARHLRLRGPARRLKKRINAIETRYLK